MFRTFKTTSMPMSIHVVYFKFQLDRPITVDEQGRDGDLFDAVNGKFMEGFYCECYPPWEGRHCNAIGKSSAQR